MICRLILAGLVALVLVVPVQAAAIPPGTGPGLTSAAVAFPVIPDGTPVIGESRDSCDNGVDISKITYDTDLGGPGGAAVFRRLDDQSVFAVIIYSSDHPMGEAYILENGAVQRMTVQELQGRYAWPCDILGGQRT